MSVTRSTMLSLITASAVVMGLASASPADASDTRFFQVVIDDTGVEPALLKVRQGDRISIRNESEREQRAKVVRNYDLMDESPIKPNTSMLFVIPENMKPGKYVVRYGDRTWYANSVVVERPEEQTAFNSLISRVTAIFTAGR